MTAVSKTNMSSDGKITIPGYALFHTNIGKQFNGFDVKLGIKNLFDKLYYFSEGYNGRTTVLYFVGLPVY